MLAIARETVVRERDTLLSFQSDLNGRLRELVMSIVNYSHDDDIHELAAIGGIIAPELAPSRSASPPIDADDPAEDAVIVANSTDDRSFGSAADEPTAGEPKGDVPAVYAGGRDDAGEGDDAANAVVPDEAVSTGDRYADFELSEIQADDNFDRAFSSFMGTDHDAEPSREWMISGE